MVAEYENAPNGEKGGILPREGLYSSHIIEWARARDAGLLGNRDSRRQDAATIPAGQRVKKSAEQLELEKLRRQNEKLQADLKKKLSDPAKALFSIMIDAPEDVFDGDQLANMLGLTTGRLGISGLLSWPSKHAAAAGRQIFWECLIGPDGPSGNCEYSMSQVQAHLFQQARDPRH